MNGNIMTNATSNENMAILIEKVVVLTKEEVILTEAIMEEMVPMVNVSSMAKKDIDPLSVSTLVDLKVVIETLLYKVNLLTLKVILRLERT